MVILLPALLSCIANPVAVPEKRPFSGDLSGVLVAGVTTADEIGARFSPPTLRGNDWWVYCDVRETWGWLICGGGAYSAACGTTDRGHTNYFMVIDFDAESTLRQYDVMREAELCTRRRICFDDDLVTIAATEAEDQAVKTFIPPAAGCSLFLYSDSDSTIIPSRAAFRFLPVGDTTTRDSFYRLEVAAGSHHLSVGPAGALWHGAGAITQVDCADGQLIFVMYRKGGMWGSPRLEMVDESEGRAAIRQRWLAPADWSG